MSPPTNQGGSDLPQGRNPPPKKGQSFPSDAFCAEDFLHFLTTSTCFYRSLIRDNPSFYREGGPTTPLPNQLPPVGSQGMGFRKIVCVDVCLSPVCLSVFMCVRTYVCVYYVPPAQRPLAMHAIRHCMCCSNLGMHILHREKMLCHIHPPPGSPPPPSPQAGHGGGAGPPLLLGARGLRQLLRQPPAVHRCVGLPPD